MVRYYIKQKGTELAKHLFGNHFGNSSVFEDKISINYTHNAELSAFLKSQSDLFLEEEQKIIKFLISSQMECTVAINETIRYKIDPKKPIYNPILHVIGPDIGQKNSGVKIKPKGVYSNNLNIDYFGFSKHIRTFSTYVKNDSLSEKNPTIEYIYDAKNLIKSFSDFRDEASYENITYNFNMFSWNFINQNSENLNLKIELYFDLGERFIKEDTNFTLPFKKSVIHLLKSEVNNEISHNFSKLYDEKASQFKINRTIVKFEYEKILTVNETVSFDAKFPLYFENCKNFKLNHMVFIVGIFFICFFAFVIYMIGNLILTDEIS
jgi:hypothetical protein